MRDFLNADPRIQRDAEKMRQLYGMGADFAPLTEPPRDDAGLIGTLILLFIGTLNGVALVKIWQWLL